MGMGFAPTSLRQVSPPLLLHKTTGRSWYSVTDPGGMEGWVDLGAHNH